MSTNLYMTNNLAIGAGDYASDAAQDAFIARKASARADGYWLLLQSRLASDGPWLMGRNFSALDLYAFMLSIWGRPTEVELRARFPGIAALADGVRARPRLKAVLEAHGVLAPGGYA